jgi:hypothetical protein
MKTILTLALIFSSIPAFAQTSTFNVKCSGLTEDRQQKVEVTTSEDGEKLVVAVYPANRERNKYDGRELEIVDSRAMFPIASIDAKRDARPLDGALVEAYLAISSELARPIGGSPAKLTIKSTIYDRREGGEKTSSTVYNISCKM